LISKLDREDLNETRNSVSEQVIHKLY